LLGLIQDSLLVRAVAGPACDRFGPRYVFAACLLAGAIPTALAGVVTTPRDLIILRFFIGILGATFVPCQVWTTAFFDKNIVGSANALTAGFGNAGGGITYFLMPAIFDSLVKDRHLSDRVAWRVTFSVPFICITATAIAMILLCPDTPTGKWSDRQIYATQNLASHESGDVVAIPDGFTGKQHPSGSTTPSHGGNDHEKHEAPQGPQAHLGEQRMLAVALREVVVNPTFGEAMRVIFSWQTLMHCGCYFCSFGTELAINSILGAYYLKNFPSLGQTGSGRWAAMFGLVNAAFRPLGGIIADIIYSGSNLWGKKAWIHFLGIAAGALLITIGAIDSHSKGVMFGLTVCMAFFLDAGNGANYALVPHVHPHANGTIPIFPTPPPTVRISRTNRDNRNHIRLYRRHGEPRGHRLRHHIPILRQRLRQGLLDHRPHEHYHQSMLELDSTDSKRSDWRAIIPHYGNT
jgi:MFS transporter, NNP family, nitrate/nitrite transporter